MLRLLSLSLALLCVVSLILWGLDGRWWGKLLLRRGTERLQMMRVYLVALLEDLWNVSGLRCLKLLLMLGRRTSVLGVLLL